MNRDELAAAFEEAYDSIMAPLMRLPREFVVRPMSDGGSLVEVAAQLSLRDQAAVRSLEACLRGENIEPDSFPALAADPSAPPARVAAEWQITHTTVTEALSRVPDDHLLVNGELPGWLIEELLDPYRHAAAQVEAWLKTFQRDSGSGLDELTVLR